MESKDLKITGFFKRDILGAIVQFMVFSEDRGPLHASTIIKDETALILYRESGPGKRTFSYQLLKRVPDILSVIEAPEKHKRRLYQYFSGFHGLS